MPTASPTLSDSSYPLTKAQASIIARSHQKSLTQLETTLQQLTEGHIYCGHSGGPITDCFTHGGAWRAAFKTFCLPNTSQKPSWEDAIKRTWMGCRPEGYLAEVETMFEREDLATISERVERERRRHIRESQTTTAPWEDLKVKKARSRAEELWVVGKDAGPYLRETIQKAQTDLENDSKLKARTEEFEKATTRGEQKAVLRDFACEPQPEDTAADLALRRKWERLFEGPMDYAEIEASMKHDIEMAKEKVRELDTKLADLQSAYMAETRKKEVEEEERRMVERENERVCEGCGKVLEVEPEGLCCERCWETRREEEGNRRLRQGWYCGEECAKGDAERHNAQYHCAS